MIYGCDDASRAGMINLCWEHFQKYKFNLWTPSPQTQNTRTLSRMYVFISRRKILPGHI